MGPVQQEIDEKRKAYSGESRAYNPSARDANEVDVTVDANYQKVFLLKGERKAIINYLYAKQQCEDWHAVADAAMDLREIDAKLSILKDSK